MSIRYIINRMTGIAVNIFTSTQLLDLHLQCNLLRHLLSNLASNRVIVLEYVLAFQQSRLRVLFRLGISQIIIIIVNRHFLPAITFTCLISTWHQANHHHHSQSSFSVNAPQISYSFTNIYTSRLIPLQLHSQPFLVILCYFIYGSNISIHDFKQIQNKVLSLPSNNLW